MINRFRSISLRQKVVPRDLHAESSLQCYNWDKNITFELKLRLIRLKTLDKCKTGKRTKGEYLYFKKSAECWCFLWTACMLNRYETQTLSNAKTQLKVRAFSIMKKKHMIHVLYSILWFKNILFMMIYIMINKRFSYSKVGIFISININWSKCH